MIKVWAQEKIEGKKPEIGVFAFKRFNQKQALSIE
jgi:hypothetical protein